MKYGLNKSQLTKLEEPISQKTAIPQIDRSSMGKGFGNNLDNEIGLSSRNQIAHRNVSIARLFNRYHILAIQSRQLSKASEAKVNQTRLLNDLLSENFSEFLKIPRDEQSIDVPDTIWTS